MKIIRRTSLFVAALFLLASNGLVPPAFGQGGVPLWTNRYNGAANSGDEASAIAVGSNGNVFVTGASGNTYGYFDYATVAYSNSGKPLWTQRYNGNAPAGHNDVPSALALDSSGNVFVTGSDGYNGNSYIVTIKYSGTGTVLWTRSWNSPNGGAFGANAGGIAVDSSGNAFVTGYAYNGSNYDYVTIKYSTSGTVMWTNFYDGPSHANDYARRVAVDSTGDVFVTGASSNQPYFGTNHDSVTIGYSGAGTPLWTNIYHLSGNGPVDPVAAAVDGSGNVFVAATLNNAAYGIIKYSNTGAPLWTNFYSADNAQPRAMALDVAGNVVVTGTPATIKYSNAGTPLWTNLLAATKYLPEAVAVDPIGNVFVTAGLGTASPSGYFTVAYSGAGTVLWTNVYSDPINGTDVPAAIAVDGSGNVFVTGLSQGISNLSVSYDYLTIKYYSAYLPAPLPQLTILPDQSGGYFINARAQPDFTCKLQRAPTLAGPWSTSEAQTGDSSGLIQFHDLFPPPRQAFYRTVQP